MGDDQEMIIIESDTCRSCGKPIDRETSPEGAAICEDCYYTDEEMPQDLADSLDEAGWFA